MRLSSKTFKKILNEGFVVTNSEIEDVIKNKTHVYIDYIGDEESKAGRRLIQPYGLILTKKGFPALRAYQISGVTNKGNLKWKMFRLDRITKWEPTSIRTKYPADKFNQYGDESASRVLMLANFTDTDNPQNDLFVNTTATEKYKWIKDAANKVQAMYKAAQKVNDTRKMAKAGELKKKLHAISNFYLQGYRKEKALNNGEALYTITNDIPKTDFEKQIDKEVDNNEIERNAADIVADKKIVREYLHIKSISNSLLNKYKIAKKKGDEETIKDAEKIYKEITFTANKFQPIYIKAKERLGLPNTKKLKKNKK